MHYKIFSDFFTIYQKELKIKINKNVIECKKNLCLLEIYHIIKLSQFSYISSSASVSCDSYIYISSIAGVL